MSLGAFIFVALTAYLILRLGCLPAIRFHLLTGPESKRSQRAAWYCAAHFASTISLLAAVAGGGTALLFYGLLVAPEGDAKETELALAVTARLRELFETWKGRWNVAALVILLVTLGIASWRTGETHWETLWQKLSTSGREPGWLRRVRFYLRSPGWLGSIGTTNRILFRVGLVLTVPGMIVVRSEAICERLDGLAEILRLEMTFSASEEQLRKLGESPSSVVLIEAVSEDESSAVEVRKEIAKAFAGALQEAKLWDEFEPRSREADVQESSKQPRRSITIVREKRTLGGPLRTAAQTEHALPSLHGAENAMRRRLEKIAREVPSLWQKIRQGAGSAKARPPTLKVAGRRQLLTHLAGMAADLTDQAMANVIAEGVTLDPLRRVFRTAANRFLATLASGGSLAEAENVVRSAGAERFTRAEVALLKAAQLRPPRTPPPVFGPTAPGPRWGASAGARNTFPGLRSVARNVVPLVALVLVVESLDSEEPASGDLPNSILLDPDPREDK
jgi:hypothetical protein